MGSGVTPEKCLILNGMQKEVNPLPILQILSSLHLFKFIFYKYCLV